jgi:multidrug efflux pump
VTVPETSLKYSILVNLLTIAILIFGLYSMVTMPREEFPAVDFGQTFVVIPYPGVSPTEIEQLIMNKVETQLSDLDDLDYISGSAEEGRAFFRVVFNTNVDSDKAFDRVSRELQKINDLPKDALDPIVIRLNMREINPISQVVVGAKGFSPQAVREIADDLKDGLLKVKNISKVELIGAREKQVWVDVDQAKLDAYGLTLSDLSGLLQGRNLNVPGGTTKFGKLEFLVRTVGQFENIDQLASMIVQSDPSGRAVRISDIATVRDTLAKPQSIARLNGTESVSIFIYKKGDSNIIKVMKDVRQYVADFKKNIPGLDVSIRNDGSLDVKNGISALGNNALMGIILVFLTMLFLLGWRNALLASIGIPLSLLITFIIAPLLGITLNNLTIFGMIIVVGMVVDNSIVVLENIHRLREEGLGHKDAIIEGVNQVIAPVWSSTLTTVASFMPLLLLSGVLGQFLRVFPIVVSVALLGSWFQSMVVLPNNVFQFGQKRQLGDDRTTRLIRPVVNIYKRIVIKALQHRQITIWSMVGALVLAFAILGSGLIRFEFFPSSPSQTIQLQFQTPEGTNLAQTEKVTEQVENFIMNMKQKKDIEYVVGNVGALGGEYQRDYATNNAQVNIDLVPLKKMKYTQDDIKTDIRGYMDKLPGILSYKFAKSQNGPPIGGAVELRITGDDLEKMAYISDFVKGKLKQIPGVVDIEDNLGNGKKEVRIIPYQEKLSMAGLTVAQIAMTIRTASTGSEVSKYRGNGVDEFPIIVKLDDVYTQDLENLKNLKIRTRTGDMVSIRDLADFQIDSSLSKIEHRDNKRQVTVSANVSNYSKNGKNAKRSPSEVNTILFGDKLRGKEGVLSTFNSRFPGYTIESGGVQEEQRKSYASMLRLFGIALLLIFTILATQFRSYVQPLIVMMTIPFAFIGVIVGLLVTGLPFSLNTLISVVALAGVVVNNAIILIDFINQEREKGTDRWHAIINSGAIRLRPILLTTGTTIAGMLPLVFSNDPSAQSWRPVAVTFAFGLAFSTFLTLFIIPVIYSGVDSFFGKFHMTRFEEHSKFAEAIGDDELHAQKKKEKEDSENNVD